MIDIGKKLLEHRLNANISQSELAKKTGIKQQNISRWEKNLNIPNIIDCIALADFFGCSTDYLLGREDDFGVIELSGAELTDAEKELLTLFRALPELRQEVLLDSVRGMAQFAKTKLV